MRKMLTSAAIVAALALPAFADNNEIFVNQAGNDNVIGNGDQPATQIGTRNLMDFSQDGHGNSIGDVGPNVNNMGQNGYKHVLVIEQPGQRNTVARYTQLGEKNDVFIRQSGNDNTIAQVRQQGAHNDIDIVQRGNGNDGEARQVGDWNVIDAIQRGHNNDFDIDSGMFGQGNACSSCDVVLRQGGNDNYANVMQVGQNQMANINQSGNGNVVHTSQSPN